MDDTIWAIAMGVVLLALVLLVVMARSCRARNLVPARLGPTWLPPEGAEEVEVPEASTVDRLVEQTGLDRRVVEVVLVGWEEYRSVLGLVSLPSSYRYRIYDPYDAPVAERGPEGPVVDPVRVARDVERRTGIHEHDAGRVLGALFTETGGSGGEQRGRAAD